MRRITAQDYIATSTMGFTKRILDNKPEGTLFALNFAPGQALPPHTHEESHLMVHVHSGMGEATVGDQKYEVGPRTILLCEGHELFSIKNTGADVMTLICMLYPTPANPAYAKDIR